MKKRETYQAFGLQKTLFNVKLKGGLGTGQKLGIIYLYISDCCVDCLSQLVTKIKGNDFFVFLI